MTLVTVLLERMANKNAILTTQMENHAARKLYEKLDWKVIQDNFHPTENTVPYVMMGKKLLDKD